jgi:peroxiredoxin
MRDDRLLQAFATLDLPVEPDAAFADRLFGDLVATLDLGAGTRAPRSFRERLARALGIGAARRPLATVRLSYVAIVVWLLLALVVGLLVVVGALLLRPDPAELVRRSQAAYEDPPAFTMVLRDPEGQTARFLSDGTGTYRLEAPGESAGSYYLYDGERSGHYEASLDTWGAGLADDRGGPIWLFNFEFTWSNTDYSGPVPVRRILPCEGASYLGESLIAGRPTDHVVCADIDMEYWLDRETAIILRIEAGPTTPNWDISGPGIQPVVEAVSFTVGPVDPALMAWSGPAGAYPEDQPPASTQLVVGEPPPAWSGQTIDGAAFSTDSLEGPAAILSFAPWCPPCHDMYRDLTELAPSVEGLQAVIVGSDAVGTVAGFADLWPTDLPVVADPDQGFITAWGMTAVPTLVLLDPGGRVAGVVQGRITREDLDRVLRAAVAGEPMPDVPPAPDPSPSPSPSPGGPPMVPVCGETEVTCWPVGAALPDWRGPLLGGGTFESASLAGRPAIVWYWDGVYDCDGPCPARVTDELLAVADAADALGSAATVVLVTSHEEVPGATRARFDELGIELRVVFDWDRAIAGAMSINMGGALLLDDEGRLVDQAVGTLEAASIQRLVDGARRLATGG